MGETCRGSGTAPSLDLWDGGRSALPKLSAIRKTEGIGHGRVKARTASGTETAAPGGGAAGAGQHGRHVRPVEPAGRGTVHQGPPSGHGAGGELRAVYCGPGQFQAGQRHPGPLGGGPGHPQRRPDPVPAVPGQRHCGPSGRGRVCGLSLRPDHRDYGAGEGGRHLPGAADRPGRGRRRQSHRQRGGPPVPGRRGALRGTLSVRRPGPVQGEKGRQARLLHPGRRVRRAGAGAVSAGEHHPPHRPAGVYGQRRGSAGDGGDNPPALCQPQLLPHPGGGPRVLCHAQAPVRAGAPGRPGGPGGGSARRAPAGPAGGVQPPGLSGRSALGLVARPGGAGGGGGPPAHHAGHHHRHLPL